jgi:hypothetical protein
LVRRLLFSTPVVAKCDGRLRSRPATTGEIDGPRWEIPMETTALEIMIWPASLTTVCALGACWLLSAVAGWANRLVAADFGLPGEADDPREPGTMAWDSGWELCDEAHSGVSVSCEKADWT